MPLSRGGSDTPPPSGWKTCSGQPYTWSTLQRAVTVRVDKCLVVTHYMANSQEEAEAWARSAYGEVVTEPLESYDFSLSDAYGCTDHHAADVDEDKAKACVQQLCLNCSLRSLSCADLGR